MSTRKKFLISVISILLILTAGAYGYGIYYFTGHFLPGSIVNGFNCSYMNIQQSEHLLSEKTDAYVLAVNTKNNGRESITAQEAGLSYASDGSIQNLMKKQNRFGWFLAFDQFKTYEIPSSITYDKDKMKQAIASLNCMQDKNITQPSDAYIKETEEGFEIVPEVEGTAPDPEKTGSQIINAMLTGQTVLDLEKTGCYKTPKVYHDDQMLIDNCSQMNKLTDVVITYDFDDRTETVDRDVIKNWLIKDENGKVVLDKNQAAGYVAGLGNKYDTIGISRTFHTYDGRQISLEGGDYGWEIDQSEETQALIKAIENGETQVREPVYFHKGLCRKTNDIGYTYIEIDLTRQRMIFYKNGTPAADTAIVSGNPNLPACETPTGCFSVDKKKSPADVLGEDYPVTPVYWVEFAGNLGINDAPWRTAFGDQLYEFEGTHGNVCVPSDQMQIIYSNVEENTPVIVYK